MRLIDLSQPISDAGPNCPAHPPVRFERIADHPADGWRMELLTCATHTGSHCDAPLHKMASGPSLDDMPIETWVARAWLVDLRPARDHLAIDAEVLQSALAGRELAGHAVLLCTGFGELREHPRWKASPAYLTPDGAAWLVESGVRGVGIDHYSIGGNDDAINVPTHETLLGSGVWVVEDLSFPDEAHAVRQPVRFWALPIRLAGASGAFCRPVLEIAE
ncbi:MAG: cyclase family protein [Planctomycetota bacterium]